MYDPISLLAALLGLNPTAMLPILILIMMVSNALARLIPDDSTGALKFANWFFSVLGMYISNRVSSGVSVSDVSTFVLDEQTTKPAIVAHAQPESKPSANPFQRGPDGRFVGVRKPAESPQGEAGFVSPALLAILLVAVLPFALAGCATTSKSVGYVCKHQDAIRAAAEATIRATDLCPIQ